MPPASGRGKQHIETSAVQRQQEEERLAALATRAQKAGTTHARASLPAWSAQERVVAAVRSQQVVVVSGETGCGKSTQAYLPTCLYACMLLCLHPQSREPLPLLQLPPVSVTLSTRSIQSTHSQVPQFILDEAIARGEGARTNIIVTQPRRIAATALAERVAVERGEVLGSGAVGYQVMTGFAAQSHL